MSIFLLSVARSAVVVALLERRLLRKSPEGFRGRVFGVRAASARGGVGNRGLFLQKNRLSFVAVGLGL